MAEDPRRVGASSPLPTERGEVSSPTADHDEGHGHGHGDGHGHGVSADADRKWLAIALVLIVGFMAAEVVVGVLAHSLALISDAGHMLTDAASIVLALVAISIAAPTGRRPLHLRSQTGRDPLGSGQRDHPAAARGVVCLRGGAPADQSARGVRAAGVGHRAGRDRGQHRCGVVYQPRQPHQSECRRRLPAHPQRPLRLHRHRDCRARSSG